MSLVFRESKTIVTLNCQSRRDIVRPRDTLVNRSYHLFCVACLLLVSLQARAQNLIYSLSTAETQASFQARFGPNSFQRPVNERLAMLRCYRKTAIYSLSMIDGQRTLLFSDEGKNFEILHLSVLGSRSRKLKHV